MTYCRNLLGASLTLIVLAVIVYGQAQIGSLLFGTFTHAHGAVIPGAILTYTVPATGASRTVVSAEYGTFVFQQILAGAYELTVSKEGFQTARRSGIQVRVYETDRVDIKLEVGSVTSAVEVQAVTPLANTYSALLSTTVDARRVQDLPLNGRDVTSLALLVAGANVDTTSTAFCGRRSDTLPEEGRLRGEENAKNATRGLKSIVIGVYFGRRLGTQTGNLGFRNTVIDRKA